MDDAPNIAIFCDYENIAIGARDAKYESFDIHLVLERLLDKGKIVVKKAYADWDRYKPYKRAMHEAAFELIEIPHVSYSGKNSADIRLVVDALDLCYTKSHVDTFVVISGDSDFSPLVSKLRENNKKVVGLGVKNSSSDLLVDNCDDFIYYDDLVRDHLKVKTKSKGGRQGRSSGPRDAEREKGAPAKKGTRSSLVPAQAAASSPAVLPAGSTEKKPEPAPGGATPLAASVTPPSGEEPEGKTHAEVQGSKDEAMEMVLETIESLFREREDNLWGSMVKQTLKRKRPHFAETFYGYRTFNQLLEEAQKLGYLELQKDEKSGGYVILSFGPNA
jgi:uncharacterized protein (TIGR00288 family)